MHSFAPRRACAFASLASLVALLAFGSSARAAASAAPATFADPATGAKITRLSTLPETGPAGVIYFTQDCITSDGRYALVRYLEKESGHTAGRMYRYEFATGALVRLGDIITKNQVMAAQSGNLYYTDVDCRAIYVTNVRDLSTRKVVDMPADLMVGSGLTVNCDETLLVTTGNLVKEQAGKAVLTTPPNQGPVFEETFQKKETNLLLSIRLRDGKVTELHRINTWLGHAQFSPTDPDLFMFCHEGPWAKVDRIWTYRIGAKNQPELVLKRTEENEIAGHEFWSTDGKTAWYDHSFRKTPGKQFLEGKNLATGEITRYPIKAPFGSIHYTQSYDGKFFVADGGTNKAHPEAQGMFILVPEGGELRCIKLCSMEKNDYKAAEPNPHLTPDQRQVIFTATFAGTPQAYAVEMPKEFWRQATPAPAAGAPAKKGRRHS